MVDLARRYDSGGKKDDPKDVRDVSIYCHNSYEKVKSVGMGFARWMSAERGTPVFPMVTITEADIDRYVKSRAEDYKEGKITPATLQTDLSALKKIEKLVNKSYGKVDWGIPEERGQRRLKWELPRRERDKTTIQRGPAYTKSQADIIVERVEKGYGRDYADALRFCRATGCRLESITNLKEKGITAERINLDMRTVTLIEKGGKTRTLQYDARYDDFIKGLKERTVDGERSEPLFAKVGLTGVKTDRDYKSADVKQLKKWEKSAGRRLESMVKKIATENGFHGRGIHGFRKEFAVRRHAEYLQEVRSIVGAGDWKGLNERFYLSENKAKDMVSSWAKAGKDRKEQLQVQRAMDNAARLRLSKDLGHNRVDVTFAYVPRKK